MKKNVPAQKASITGKHTLQLFFDKLSHITLIPEKICAFLIKQCVSIMAFFMTTCILCSEDMQRDDDYPSHTHCIFQDVAHRVENSPILLLSYTWRRIKDFQIPNTAEAGISKTIRRYLLFSTDGVPSNLCVGLTFALLWCWFVHCRFVNLISSSLAKAFLFFLFYLISSSLAKVFLISWSLYKVCLSFLEGWVSLCLLMLAIFLTKNAYVQPSENSNDKIVSTHTKCVSLVEFHFSF